MLYEEEGECISDATYKYLFDLEIQKGLYNIYKKQLKNFVVCTRYIANAPKMPVYDPF